MPSLFVASMPTASAPPSTVIFSRAPSSAPIPSFSPVCPRRAAAGHVARARRSGVSSRTQRRMDSIDKKGGRSPGTAFEEKEGEGESVAVPLGFEVSTTPMPVLPGEQNDFWEGSSWDAFGFFVQYLWAFGGVFALIACGIAVSSFNEGAADFKETPAYKESVQSRELLEEQDSSSSNVFEANPTEVAPSLE